MPKTSWFRCAQCGFNFLYKDRKHVKGIGWLCWKCESDLRDQVELDRRFEFIMGDLG